MIRKITANSDKVFYVSKKTAPNKSEKFKGKLNKSTPVKDWAGSSKDCSFSPIKKGGIVIVCDAILSTKKETWYYIKYNGKYGFVNSSYVVGISDKAIEFVNYLEQIHTFVKANGKYFEYGYKSEFSTFEKAKKTVEGKKKVSITCVVPCRWGLKHLSISFSNFWGKNGSFKHCYTGAIKTYFERITSGEPIGLTVKQAVDKRLLEVGDIITFKDYSHTFVYTGYDYIVYDGGHASIANNIYTGIKPDYSKKNKSRKISEILRWK